jgi:branched-chain amino acid transport system ATP-binding protein
MFSIENLSCGYGAFVAARGVSLEILPGTITALLGPNGSGKSSLLMCIAGHVSLLEGRVVMDDQDIGRLPTVDRVRRGLAICPEGRRVFKDLTVEDNLKVGGVIHPQKCFREDRDYVLALFPRLSERLNLLAGNLSGGEQQMLAIGRALMARPRLIMIDELSLGLMPKVIDLCYESLFRLKKEGLGILLVEQNTDRALTAADDVCVLESGRTVWQGKAVQARGNSRFAEVFLGIKDSMGKKSPQGPSGG